jgi:hypothetical protein
MGDEMLGNIVMVRSGPREEEKELALVRSFTDQPTYWVQNVEGASYTWLAALTRPATAQEAAEYWHRRARAAEAKLAQTINGDRPEGGDAK